MGGNTFREWLVKSLSTRGNKKAISFLRTGTVETEISYRGLNEDSNRMANTLINLGVKKGDRVVLFLPKSMGFIIAYLALHKIGAVAVPLNPGFKQSEMTYLLEDTEPSLVVSGSEQESMIRDTAPGLAVLVIATEKPYQELDVFRSVPSSEPDVQIGPEDAGIIIYTSGTTGRPKGAILTQGNLFHDARNITTIWEIRDSDVLCHALPLFHVHGLCFALHTALVAGTHVILLDEFSPERVLDVLAKKGGEYGCTVFMAVPSMYVKMVDHVGEKGLDFDHVRLWTSGSAPLLPKDFGRIRRIFGKEPVEREGMSETGMNFSNPLHGTRKPGSIGLPLPDLQVRIVDPETLTDVPMCQTGEIWLKGPAVTPGYWRRHDETEKAFEGGWFRTGDLGRIDENGYYYLTDRIKNIIISGGENISPKEVETVINQLDEVLESSVIGIPDEKWGEKVVAAVVTKPDVNIRPRKIREFCKQHLHNWKCPKEILFVGELPKNRMGKVLRDEVKKSFKP
jgi:malonyl-CoA/methylmalonyl-CoA synthetase